MRALARLQLQFFMCSLHMSTSLVCFDGIINIGWFLPHCMQPTRFSHAKAAIRPSVRLSDKHVICDKTKETYAHILTPHERSFILVLWQEEWLVGGRPLLPEILCQTGPVRAKSPIFSRYSLVALQP